MIYYKKTTHYWYRYNETSKEEYAKPLDGGKWHTPVTYANKETWNNSFDAEHRETEVSAFESLDNPIEVLYA